ncbi:hypothetical protein BC828DRAFT_375252 [Blastocladiella britannica]|nr:hypothetical protein BC828DRAFT_375252 [Blastocladiella britannica]
MSTTIKILVAGPPRVGKSVVSNFLASMERPDMLRAYTPTPHVRILEFTRDLSRVKAPATALRLGRVNVELWDLTGDDSYAGHWPAVAPDAHGLLLIMNADDPSHPKQLEQCASAFPTLRDTQLLVFAHKQENASQSRARPKLAGRLARSVVVSSSLDNPADTESMRAEFDTWLAACAREAGEQRGRDERDLVGSAVTAAAAEVGGQAV